jgi:hypothetical protein
MVVHPADPATADASAGVEVARRWRITIDSQGWKKELNCQGGMRRRQQ